MMNYNVIPVGTWSVYGDIGWYLMVLCHYKLVLFGTWLYRVSKRLLCLNELQNGDLVGCHQCQTFSPTDNNN